jgi:hypothetical protein
LIAIYQQLLIPILAKPDKSYKIKSIFDIWSIINEGGQPILEGGAVVNPGPFAILQQQVIRLILAKHKFKNEVSYLAYAFLSVLVVDR